MASASFRFTSLIFSPSARYGAKALVRHYLMSGLWLVLASSCERPRIEDSETPADDIPTIGDDDDDILTTLDDDDDEGDDDDGNASDDDDDSDDPGDDDSDVILPDLIFDVHSPDVTEIPFGCPTLTATIRDFSTDHPDFETYESDFETLGLVQTMLGPDQKPQYVGTGPNSQMSGKEYFDQWYTDVMNVNIPFEREIVMTEVSPGTCSYSNNRFFPIDGVGFGDEGLRDADGNLHNFLFTTEIHTTFVYRPGQTFTFIGDDDLWMFVDHKLALDIGGLHPAVEKSVDLDTLGLIEDATYDMDIFHAERHTFDSNFRIDSNIDFNPPK
jgi:fibro-slime domain-containing protein